MGYSDSAANRANLVLDWILGQVSTVPWSDKLAWGIEGRAESSVNHESQAWANEAARAAVALFRQAPKRKRKLGAEAMDVLRQRWLAARAVLLHYFDREDGALWVQETLCSDNHTSQHLLPVGMARVAAVVSGDETLLERSGRLLRRNAAALGLGAGPATGYISLAGTRCLPLGPRWYSGTAWLREVRGLPGPLPEFAGKRREENLRFGSGVHVRALIVLREALGDDLAGAGSVEPAPCRTKLRVRVWRGPDGHLSVVPREQAWLPPHGELCDWTLASYGHKTFKEFATAVRVGRGFEMPPPKVPDGWVHYEFGPDVKNKEG